MPSRVRKPCRPVERAFRGRPSSHSSTRRRQRPRMSAALKPAGPPPTIITSQSIYLAAVIERLPDLFRALQMLPDGRQCLRRPLLHFSIVRRVALAFEFAHGFFVLADHRGHIGPIKFGA